jgi:2-polyprenyl-3-methyl-5-hydroxy-6-metoxy-1,4-benzoquinol methylase
MASKARQTSKRPSALKVSGHSRKLAELRAGLAKTIEAADFLHNWGSFRQAEEYYRQVLAADPTNPTVSKLFRSLYSDSGDIAAAAWASQGRVFEERGQHEVALVCYGKVLKLNQNFPGAWEHFSRLVELVGLQIRLSDLIGTDLDRRELLVSSLIRTENVPQVFFHACFHELFRDDTLAATHDFIAAKEDFEGYQNFIENSCLNHLFSDQLFLLMLKRTLIADQLAEAFLTHLRRVFVVLLTSDGMDEHFCEKLTPIVCAIAQQCYLNEYVFQKTEAEAELLSKIIKELETADSLSTPRCVIRLAVLDCYANLGSYKVAEKLAEREMAGNHAFAELLQILFATTRKEKELAEQIRCLSEVDDEISQRVMRQYVENPYPRWDDIYLPQPKPFVEYLQGVVHPNLPLDLIAIDSPEVLIAGCGTGRHAIQCAAAYRSASVVAVDLSRSSLAYASRKAIELGIRNIEFIQGDILNLKQLNSAFDVIECCGVLHHMGEPKQGLRTLVDLLKPSGYMLVSLYSEIARKQIVAARDFVESHGFDATIEGIRGCRQAILALPDENVMKALAKNIEFYSTSTVRDLICHVQEVRFTLPEIALLLEEFNLEFLGFDLDIRRKNQYLQQYRDDPAATSLANWHCFEQKNTDTFAGMYELWLRKKTWAKGLPEPSGDS